MGGCHRPVPGACPLNVRPRARDLYMRLQDRIDSIWSCMMGGCHLNRDTLSVIREAGIEITRHKRYGMIEVIEGRAAP